MNTCYNIVLFGFVTVIIISITGCTLLIPSNKDAQNPGESAKHVVKNYIAADATPYQGAGSNNVSEVIRIYGDQSRKKTENEPVRRKRNNSIYKIKGTKTDSTKSFLKSYEKKFLMKQTLAFLIQFFGNMNHRSQMHQQSNSRYGYEMKSSSVPVDFALNSVGSIRNSTGSNPQTASSTSDSTGSISDSAGSSPESAGPIRNSNELRNNDIRTDSSLSATLNSYSMSKLLHIFQNVSRVPKTDVTDPGITSVCCING